MPYLYRFEAKRIQSWILSSDRLKELKGGSECINALRARADALRRQWKNGAESSVVMSAAGNGMYRFETLEALAAFSSVWPMVVAAHAPGLPLVQAAVAFEGSTEESEKQAIADVFAALGQALRESPRSAAIPGPFIVRSGRTGAAGVGTGDAGEIQDQAIRQKLAYANDAATHDGAQERRLMQGIESHFEADLHKWRCDYVAVIHADGNRMADVFRGKSIEIVRALSSELTRITLEAATTAVHVIHAHLAEERVVGDRSEHGGGLPVRPVVVGGDDVTFIVEARLGLSFAAAFLHSFESLCEQSTRTELHGVTASAGVALVKVGWPFHMAHDLAEALCEDAKKASRAQKCSTLSFHRVTDAFVGSLTDIRKRTLSRGTDTLAWGGYTLPELHNLFDVVQAMQHRTVPSGKLREWCRQAITDPREAEAIWRRTRAVAEQDTSSSNQWPTLSSALRQLNCNAYDGPWAKVSDGRRTVLHDAIAWSMVSKGKPTLRLEV